MSLSVADVVGALEAGHDSSVVTFETPCERLITPGTTARRRPRRQTADNHRAHARPTLWPVQSTVSQHFGHRLRLIIHQCFDIAQAQANSNKVDWHPQLIHVPLISNAGPHCKRPRHHRTGLAKVCVVPHAAKMREKIVSRTISHTDIASRKCIHRSYRP